jgi:quercetin dioxygenase-like cupin family protein
MKNLNRRELCVALSALAAMSGELSHANAESLANPGDTDLGGSHVIAYADLPVHKNANGGESRQVMSGVVKTGEYLEIHETMLPAGQMPHPPHKHPNTEVLFIQTGNLEYINDGKPEPVGPGGIIFTASNVMHGLKNVGTTPATYIVVSVGRQLPHALDRLLFLP